MAGEIHEISKAIGQLQAQIGHLTLVQGAADARAQEHRKEIVQKIDAMSEKFDQRLQTNEKDISELKGFRNNIVAVVAVLTGIASAVWAMLGDFVSTAVKKVIG